MCPLRVTRLTRRAVDAGVTGRASARPLVHRIRTSADAGRLVHVDARVA